MQRFLILALAAMAAGVATAGPLDPVYKAGEVIVKFNPVNGKMPAPTVRNAAHARLGAVELRQISDISVVNVKLPAGMTVEQGVAFYESQPGVAYAEPNYFYRTQRTPNDPLFGSQWQHNRIRTPEAWNITTGDSRVIIAILDTGVDLTHPDLVGKLTPGWDYEDNDNDPQDSQGHGTFCAGLAAAATNNARQVAGVSWGARIMPARVGPGPFLSGDAILDAMTDTVDRGARVISMSFGGGFFSQAQQDAVNYGHARGAVYLAASGNSGVTSKFYPAALNNVLSVGASTQNDTREPFSNYGADWVDIAAPGNQVPSTIMGGGAGPQGFGTSWSCPIAAGVVALVMGFAPPNTSNTQIINWVTSTCDPVGNWVKYGRVNAFRAVSQVPVANPNNYMPANPQTITGVRARGDAASLRALDGNMYVVRTAAATRAIGPVSFMSADFDVSDDMSNLISLSVNVNAMASVRGVTQQIFAWNWNAGRWDIMRATPAATGSPNTMVKVDMLTFAPYVSRSGQVRIGLRALMPSTAPVQNYQFMVDRVTMSSRVRSTN